MEQVVLVNCALAAQRAGGWAVGWRRLAPTAFKMPPLSGLSSQPDHNFTIRANPKTVLLRVSESSWFNLSFAFMHTDEADDRQNLFAGSNADRLTSKPYCRVLVQSSIDRQPSAVRLSTIAS